MPLSNNGSQPNCTVVTACDSKFVWGAMLLGLSLRYNGVGCDYHILGYDLTDVEIRQLNSIPNARVFPAVKTSFKSVCTQKPEAIATSDTDITVWMDADCIVKGKLDEFFVCPDNKIQIRWRGIQENASVYRNYYKKGDMWGNIPLQVLKQWEKDVGDLTTPQTSTVCQTNCFVIDKTHKQFINLWKEQMDKVIPVDTIGVYSKKSVAYSMTDESVLNSLFAFNSNAPSTSEYLMDKDPDKICLHFGLNPKPWQHWTKQSLVRYTYIMELIEWGGNNHIALPVIPDSFLKKNRLKETLMANLDYLCKNLRFVISNAFRRFKHRII